MHKVGEIPEYRIVHLPDALKEHASKNVVLYIRESSPTSKTNGTLERQKTDEHRSIKGLVGEEGILAIIGGVELGQICVRRNHLRKAIHVARQRDAILCARDVSRFIRSQLYHRRLNWAVEPTADEFRALFELADGVVLATRLHPSLSEAERHSLATKNSRKPCGRPSSISHKLISVILEDLQTASIAEVARRFGVSESAIKRLKKAQSETNY